MENLVVSTRKRLVMDKMYCQVKVVADNTIKNILNANVRASVDSCECTGGAVSISGKMTATVVYVNAEGMVESAVASTEFIEKQKADFVMTDVFATTEVEIENINFSSNEAMLALSHIASVDGVFEYEIPMIENSDHNLVLKTNSFSANNLKFAFEDNFAINEEYQTNLENVDVISSNSKVVVEEVIASVDKLIVSGKVVADVLYKRDDAVETLSKEFDFSQEIAGNGVVPNMMADALVCVKNVNISTETRTEKCVFVYSIELGTKVYVYEDSTFELVDDMFSLSNELATTYSYLEAKNFKGFKTTENTFSSNVDISAVEGLDDIVCVYETGSKIVEVKEQENKVVVFARQNVCVLYKTETGIESLEEDVDFEFDISKENASKIAGCKVVGEIVSYKVKAGRDIEIILKYSCNYGFEEEYSVGYIKSYEIVGEKPASEGGIKVYISKGEQSVFDVAKILNVTPEIIKEQNEIDEPFEAGQKIYVYSPVNLF